MNLLHFTAGQGTALTVGKDIRQEVCTRRVILQTILSHQFPIVLAESHQFVIDPSGRKYVWARAVTGSVISAICVRCFKSSSTPNPGRSFGYSFPSLKSRHTGTCSRVRPW